MSFHLLFPLQDKKANKKANKKADEKVKKQIFFEK